MGSIETFTVADARRYHEATYSIGLGAGRRFVRQVDLSDRKRIMDIGGGSGAYCIAAANEHPSIRAVVLDLVAHERLAGRDETRLRVRMGAVDEPDLGRLVVADRNGHETV